MNKREYAAEVCKHLNKAGFETKIEENYRNNASKVAIMVKRPDKKVSPVFCVEDDSITAEEFAENIMSFEPVDISTDSLEEVMFEKEKVLERVHYILVNKEMNRSRKHIVRRQINRTLELQYKVDISDILDGARVALEDRRIEKLGIDSDELYFRAYENTMKKFPVIIKPIGELIGCDFLDDIPGLYVLTNSSMIYGAGAVLYKGVKELLEDTVAEETIILPSSVHEVIVIPSYLGQIDTLTQMIREINRSVVSPEEVLSDRPYELITDGVLFEL